MKPDGCNDNLMAILSKIISLNEDKNLKSEAVCYLETMLIFTTAIQRQSWHFEKLSVEPFRD